MTVPQSSLLTRVALSAMSLALRYWPEDSRRWEKFRSRGRR
jgi:hypothetical protein